MNDRGGPIYTGRFAPSPTGPLHAGSLVAALASWLDARAHGGRWLVRIENVDLPRCVPGADCEILAQLAACGLISDEPPVYQSARGALYASALGRLQQQALAYPCGCTRLDIERALASQGRPLQRHGERVYPGTCRDGLHGRAPRAWRLLTENHQLNTASAHTNPTRIAIQSIADKLPAEAGVIAPGVTARTWHPPDSGVATAWHDRALGPQQQVVASEVGDFVLRRADGLWAYQLAVVVDDAEQRITHVVRGEDLAHNTARQILLQHALGLPVPLYLHTPLVRGANGEKLSKQNGAQPVDTHDPLAALRNAGRVLGLAVDALPAAGAPRSWLDSALPLWAARHGRADAANS